MLTLISRREKRIVSTSKVNTFLLSDGDTLVIGPQSEITKLCDWIINNGIQSVYNDAEDMLKEYGQFMFSTLLDGSTAIRLYK